MRNRECQLYQDIDENVVNSPHIVLLGAGASVAVCPKEDKNGLMPTDKKNMLNREIKRLILKGVLQDILDYLLHIF